MIRNVYGVRDTLAGETLLILHDNNDDTLKRNVKALLLDRRPNPINAQTKDTLIFQLGTLDTESGILTAMPTPRMALNVEIVRQELLQEIRMSKMMAGDTSTTDKLPVEEIEESQKDMAGKGFESHE